MDVDNLTQSTRESMLKTLAAMSHTEEDKVDAAHTTGVATAVEI